MRFQVTGWGWPIGSWLVPSGTIIDTTNGTDTWSQLAAGLNLVAPPANCTPLDSTTYDAMATQYSDTGLVAFYGITDPNQ